MDGAGPGVYANAVFRLTIRRELLLECCDFATERELAAVENALNRSVDFVLDRSVLRLKIDKRNHDFFPLRCMYTVSPFARIELVAASISSTTRRPRRPSVSGALVCRMQS